MRIIAGSAKGAKLSAPDGLLTRPTPDMVRESLFNIIQDNIPGARFLDLFAGSGAVGLEALSRGAGSAVFVDSRRLCVDKIRQNAAKTRFSDKSRMLCMEAVKAARMLSDENRVFDIIYLDPPYGSGLLEKALYWVAELGLLAPGGMIVSECGGGDSELREESLPPGFSLLRQKRYGKTALHFLQRKLGG